MASNSCTSGCKKRHRQASSCTDDHAAEIKRCGVTHRCASIGGVGEDDMYLLYDDDDDEKAAKEDDKGQKYVVLTEDDVRARQEADTALVANFLSIPKGFAAVLLRHFEWRTERLWLKWFSDGRRVCDAVGLRLPAFCGALVPPPRSHYVCAICFDEHPAGRTRSAGCSHHYCDGCWRGYIHAAVGNGPACLSLQCPDPACSAAVVQDLVDAVADADDRHRYAWFALRSYVDKGRSGIKWCPAPGCTRAVEFRFLGDADATTDVFCDCKNGFCWSCGEEAHRPVSCDTVRAWLAKNISDAATANWILTNTKKCPSCQRPIQKNQGCNHMTCTAPCRHQFCWLCLDPWNGHLGCSRSRYDQQQETRQAKASVGRYLYHYERWAANGKSLHKALADMDQLERSELEGMAMAVDLPATELGFVTEAYHQIAGGRRVLRWAHAYGYFLDPEHDAAKQGLFDDLQSQAIRWLECLHGCAELERKQLFGADTGASPVVVAADTFRAYREKLANLTGVTRKFVGNLVKAFETDLPEVLKPPFAQIVNPPTMGYQTVGVESIISTATVKVEPAAVPQTVSAPALSHLTPISNVASQGISTPQTSSPSRTSQESNIANDYVQEHRHIINHVQQPICDLLSVWHSIGTSMGLPNVGTRTTPSGVTSTPSVPSSMSVPGQPIGTLQMVQSTALGSFCSNTSTLSGSSIIASSSSQPNSMDMGQEAGVNSLGVTNNAAMNIPTPIGQRPNSQQPPPNYVKIWEGTLAGQRQGQPVFICKLESWSGTSSEILAKGWPETMQIVRLIAQEHMNNKQYVDQSAFLIFRTLNQHGFLQQLHEKKLCAVIQLQSQTLLLSISDKEGHLIGMLFPKMLQQQQQLQHQQQLQLQQQLQPQQQMQQLQQNQQLRDKKQLQQ